MSSLTASLSIATGAMLAEEGAMQSTSNNLANVNTPGYSREVPTFEPNDPVVSGSISYGEGVNLEGFQGLRDSILNMRIDEEHQNQGDYQSYTAAMNQVQTLFSDASGGVGGAITSFFNSISNLTTQPDSTSLRSSVLSSAQNVVSTFHNTATALSTQQSDLNLQVNQSVEQVNQLSTQIAVLNTKISGMQALGENPGSFEDQRDEAISNLSDIVNVSQTETENGLTLTTANGVALVVDGKSFALSTSVDPATSMLQVMSGASNLTAQITSGSLAGTIAVRDAAIPQLQSNLDQLAANFSSAVNKVHETGVDLNGNPGSALFSVPPANPTGAAAMIEVNLTDPSHLAMSSSGPGGNDVANALLALQNEPVVGDQTPIGAYSQMVFQVGSEISNAQSASETSTSILQQLQSQQSSVSGVSIDEETANLMQFQSGFSAAAHVITVIDSLLQDVLGMGVTQ
jgi:flagellar hook-associated protein 1 FlgK